MEFFADTSVRPSELPIVERENWHRAAWTFEQIELAALVPVQQRTEEVMPSELWRAIYTTA